ncbi:MAG: hypothetical protein QOF78_3813 [Phycisphaerales bacterium]|jgi:hypothetical protein|nr:hypothetical protein [Phycisphaerales bacterium]
MNATFTRSLSQLLAQTPLLLVYLGGMMVCALMWRRAGRGAMLAMIGLGLMLVSTVGSALVVSVMVFGPSATGTSAVSLGQTLTVIAIGSSILRAGGLALVIAGVFANRPEFATPGGFEVQPPEYPR